MLNITDDIASKRSVQAARYLPTGNELAVLEAARVQGVPLMLKGPTGCGKSRFVEYAAEHFGRPLVQVACNEDTSATDLLGRHLLIGGETIWQDGPVTRAVREGAFLYLDEIAEAREDVVVLLHSLSDHRRELYVDRINETLRADADFQLFISFNPGYQRGFKQLKPSTRQRFVGIDFDYPDSATETRILVLETGIEESQAASLVKLATRIRSLKEIPLPETASTRLLVHAAQLIQAGLGPRQACDAAIVSALSDDADIATALRDVVRLCV